MFRKFWNTVREYWDDLIIAGACLSMLILVACCGWVALHSLNHYPIHDESDKELIQLLKSLQSSEFDSTHDLNFFSRKDKETVVEAQKLIVARQEVLVDDYRQETNNLINKMNGWLAFWIAVIGLLGIVVPLASQIKASRDARNLENEMKERVNKSIAESRQSVADIQFMTWIRIFNTIFDARELSDTAVRDSIARFVWNNILDGLGAYVSDYATPDNRERNVHTHLSVALVMLSSNLSTLRHHSQRRVRIINNAADRIRDIVNSLNNPDTEKDVILRQLSALMGTLRAIL